MDNKKDTAVADIERQLTLYAESLSRVYRSEKEKRRELEAANRQLLAFATDLKETVAGLRRTQQDLKAAYLDTINRLVMAAEYKDEDTGDHIVRMSGYSALIAPSYTSCLSPSRTPKTIISGIDSA